MPRTQSTAEWLLGVIRQQDWITRQETIARLERSHSVACREVRLKALSLLAPDEALHGVCTGKPPPPIIPLGFDKSRRPPMQRPRELTQKRITDYFKKREPLVQQKLSKYFRRA